MAAEALVIIKKKGRKRTLSLSNAHYAKRSQKRQKRTKIDFKKKIT